MYKIILAFCLVLAVAEGLPEIGKLKNTFDLLKARTEININLAKQRCNPMSLNIERTKIKSAEDSLEKLIKLNAELSAIPAKECQNEFKENLDLKQHCFHPNIPTCKSTMRDCIAEASYQVGGGLLRNIFEEYSTFERHNSIAFDFNIANCTQTYPILSLDYEKCVDDAISTRNIHVKLNQEIFEDEMNEIEDTSKEFVEELQYSVSVFKSRQSKS